MLAYSTKVILIFTLQDAAKCDILSFLMTGSDVLGICLFLLIKPNMSDTDLVMTCPVLLPFRWW